MKRNYSDIYNSLSSSPHNRSKSRYDASTISSLSPPFWLSEDPLESPPPLKVSQSAPSVLGHFQPPPTFDPPACPEPASSGFGSVSKKTKVHSAPKQHLEGLWTPPTRPKRAYTEGDRPSYLFSHLCEQLALAQSQKSCLLQSITYLEDYIASKSHYERDIDFSLDKCLDNAERKLKKNKISLEKIQQQILTLETQIPSNKGFPIYYPLPTPPLQDTKKNYPSKKTKFFHFLKKHKRAKT